MQKFTYLMVAAALAAATPADAFQHPKVSSLFAKQEKQKAADSKNIKDIKRFLTRSEDSKVLWRPANETVYAWYGNRWILDGQHTLTYDDEGRIIKDVTKNYDGSYFRTTYAYDANGMVVSKLEETSYDGSTFEYSSKTEKTYDPRITNLVVTNREYEWEDGKWLALGNNYNRKVTRDAQGNVTEVEIAVLFEGIYDPTIRIHINYGEYGEAKAIKESLLTYKNGEYTWEDGITIENITWVETDGQIVAAEPYTSGANRMKSFKITDEISSLCMELSYDGNNYSVTANGINDGAAMQAISSYEQLDSYGSYRQTSDSYYTVEGTGTFHEVETYTLRYDAYGNMLESKDVVNYDGEEEIYEDVQGTVEYDPTLGYPLLYTMSQGYVNELTGHYELENIMKVEFSDYQQITTSGVKHIDAPQKEGEVEFYTLQGVKVANPTPGNIYIRKTSDSTTKFMVK